MEVEKREEAARRCEEYRSMGYACSESVFRALAQVFDIPVSRELCRSISIFAGGAAYDGRCGVLEAGLALVAGLGKQGNRCPSDSTSAGCISCLPRSTTDFYVLRFFIPAMRNTKRPMKVKRTFNVPL